MIKLTSDNTNFQEIVKNTEINIVIKIYDF